jgi:putative mRNA 3-end processing factor
MKVKFLGGASVVGSLAMYTEIDGESLLFDFGFTPSKPPKFPKYPPKVDTAFLTHAHIDHSGLMPWLAGHYETQFFGTPVTMDLSMLLCEDSLKIAKQEAYPFPYDPGDVFRFKRNFEEVHYGSKVEVGTEDAFVEGRSAGHIPGSTMWVIESDKKYVFTGDINTIDTRLVKGNKPVKCDVLFMEATYSTSDHPDRDKVEVDFLDKIDEVVNRGGIAIVPAFAVGRTQEVLMLLYEEGYRVWLDGMGKTVNEILMDHSKYVSSAQALKNSVKKVKEVYSNHGRKLAIEEGEVIVTTSGMLDGGPVMEYMLRIKDDPKSAILLTGYQVEGSNGRLLTDQRMIDFYGVKEKMQCEVAAFDLSAHAGRSELIEFARKCEPEKIVLCHSDDREAIAEALRKDFEVLTPMELEEIDI